MTEANPLDCRPFLAKFAIARSGSSDIPGYYSTERDVWVVESPDGQTPIVSLTKMHLDGPVTKVKGERDPMDVQIILEMATKTKYQIEGDDTSPGSARLLELETKTFVIRERDDNAPGSYTFLSELVTKTAANRERDDQ